METSAQIVEHPAEVRLRLRAPTLAGVMAVAGRTLAALELGRPPEGGAAGGEWREIELRARDAEALLVEWLNELIYLAEAERWVAAEFDIGRVTATELAARARGISVEMAPSRVKAATFHGIRVATVPGGVEAEVVLDV